MNVLFIDQFSDIGGGQLCLLDVMTDVRRRGWSGTLAAPGDGPLISRASALGLNMVELPSDVATRAVWKAGPYIRRSNERAQVLSRTIRDGRFDLSYVNGPRILPAAAIACGASLPMIFHAHNRPVSPVARAIAGWSVRSTQATVIACCRFVADVYCTYALADRLHVVLNGVEEIPYTERAFTAPLLIGMIGRIEPQKGQLRFVEAARMLLASGIDCEFVVCGSPGPSCGKYVDQVESAAAGLPFRFMPWQDDVADVLRSLDLLVVPSTNEGLPRVILEAFSAGVPVVGFRTGGIPEVVRDRETGFLVDEPTGGELGERMIQICGDERERLPEIAANARAQWESHHQVSTFTGHVVALMERAVRDHGAGRKTTTLQPHRASMRR
jgi:glycosyltransferase involved in cell wall biosynthesis